MDILNLLTGLDPQTQDTLNKVKDILFPIIYSLAGFALILVGVRYGVKIYKEPEERGTHIKHMVFAFGGIMLIFLATGIGNIIMAKYLGLL